jgi:hypothetical protein
MMKPLTISSAQVKSLLLKLGNDNEEVWKPAFEELEYFDPRLAIDLQTLMERYMDSPTRQRMVEVMSGRQAGQLGRRGGQPEARRSGRMQFLRAAQLRLMVGRAQDRAHQQGFAAQHQEEMDSCRPHPPHDEYNYADKQSIPTIGLSPASPTALWAPEVGPTRWTGPATDRNRIFDLARGR